MAGGQQLCAQVLVTLLLTGLTLQALPSFDLLWPVGRGLRHNRLSSLQVYVV